MIRQLFVLMAFMALSILPAQAESKLPIIDYGPGHWEQQGNFQPYIDHPTRTQTNQWSRDPWQPSHWAIQRPGGGSQVIEDFYKADILRGQYTRNGTAAVDVGPGFFMLGGNDQRKVATMIDYVYGITKNDLYGMFTLYDWNSRKPIGTYTQYGLQMQ